MSPCLSTDYCAVNSIVAAILGLDHEQFDARPFADFTENGAKARIERDAASHYQRLAFAALKREV